MKTSTRIVKFLTNAVFLLTLFGVLLIIIGQSSTISHALIPIFPALEGNTSLDQIIKSLGGALLGSGVFTAIIKSSEYTAIFSDVIEKIIWSKEFLTKRSDKKELWGLLTRLMYEEKFPELSDEIEEIITKNYIPTETKYYIENYDYLTNILSHNANFSKHEEVINFTIKTKSTKETIKYSFNAKIDMSTDPAIPDETNYVVQEVLVNGSPFNLPSPVPTVQNNIKHFELTLTLQGNEEYLISIKRYKVQCIKSNPDKRMFANTFIKDMKVTMIAQTGTNIDLYKMGTIGEFVAATPQNNNGTVFLTWHYKGLILPHQGFCVIFK
jgi:hypothetical protein